MRGLVRRPSMRHGRGDGRAAALPAIVVAAGLVLGCVVPAARSAESPTADPSAPSPAASLVASPATSPEPSPQASAAPVAAESPAPTWGPVEALVPAPVAQLEATKAGVASVALDTRFRLRSLAGEPVASLAERLVVTPATELRLEAEQDDTALLAPAEPLRASELYRFELRRTDGTTEAAWAFQAASPLRVVTTVPANADTGVPDSTGIEVTFNQDGVRLEDVRAHASISPTTRGRWQQHGPTFSFIPERPLEATRLYTLTITAGVPLPGTGMTLEEPFRLRFETEGVLLSRVHVTMTRTLFDAMRGERPVIGLYLDSPSGRRLSSVAVKVHRLASYSDAIDAWRRVRAAPDWSVRSGIRAVSTTSLTRVVSATLPVGYEPEESWRGWVRLPSSLHSGWYVVTVVHGGIPRQTVLQVSDLSAYAVTTGTRSAVWVNDLRSNDPVAGAVVTLAGERLGTTARNGLLVAPTPTAIRKGTAPEEVAVVRDGTRRILVPLAPSGCWECGDGDPAGDAWWRLITLDRAQYRNADTINAWGVLRDRQTNEVPEQATVTLLAADNGTGSRPAIERDTVKPDATGAWATRLPVTNLPSGDYVVEVRVGATTVTRAWLVIAPFAKPAWRMEVDAPVHAVLTGASTAVNAAASFFEGTPVVGASLLFTPENADDEDDEAGVLATTGIDGRTTGRVVLRMPPDSVDWDNDQWRVSEIYVRANEPEDGDVSASEQIAVFRSTAILDLAPRVSGTTLTIRGAVHAVDFTRFETDAGDALSAIDPRGGPLAGRRVNLTIVERTYVTRQVGTRYDFVAKRTVPVYRTSVTKVTLPGRTATTASDGTYRLTLTVRGGNRSYQVVATHTDAGGRRVTARQDAGQASPEDSSQHARLQNIAGNELPEYSIGDTVSVRFAGGIRAPETARHLFLVASRGLRVARVQASPRFDTVFTAAMVPNATVLGVRFTGTSYEVTWDNQIAYRLRDRELMVRVTTDRERYRPGERVTATIETRSPGRRPLAASVFVRAVDEKLFAIGAATMDDPLGEVYAWVDHGLLTTGRSHLGPFDDDDGGWGDTTGGGDREDFRDWLLAELVHTGSDGRATVSFDLSDDLTSWRIVASGVTASLRAGVGHAHAPVSLPFFADVVAAPEYLVADRPAIRVRAFGTALAAGEAVRFTVTSDTMPMAEVAVDGTAFTPVEVSLPPMPAGAQRIRVTATTVGRNPELVDTLVRTFDVLATRATRSFVTATPLTDDTTVGGGAGLTHVTLVDAGRGRVVPLLEEAAGADPFRADRAIAAAMARDILAREYGIPDRAELPPVDLTPFQPWDGVRLVAWGSEDLEASAMAAFSGEARLNRDQLLSYLHDLEEDEGSEGAIPLTRRLSLLLARASLGDATLDELVAEAARTDLTPSQEVLVALTAVALGDEATARRLYLEILADHGRRLGPWVRVDAGAGDATSVATARLAIVASVLGDPLAADMDAEVVAHPPTDTLVDLERVIAAGWWARRVPDAAATAAVTIDGVRSEMTTTAREPVAFDVTAAQRESLRIDPVDGSIVVVARWDGPVDDGALEAPVGVSVVRTVTPDGPIAPTRTVVVSYAVTLGATAVTGCWRLTDLVPSGLVPVDNGGRQGEVEETDDTGEPLGDFVQPPSMVDGQRVEFCVEPDPRRPTTELRYLARVITSGTYAWEPTVLQSMVVPAQGIALPATTVTVEGLGG